ncbi:PAS domain-containing sensor histidine kinase [Billgrantia sp. Q4P2]|uniref:PAS domain-containing sensor histidine kinase n=1 Tax=Billgrantia sp. Q4P2 TaxID=3463857 RepID=UPI004055D74C
MTLSQPPSEVDILRHENSLLRTLIESTREPAIFVTDPDQDFRFVLVNEAVCRHFGVPREQVLQWSPADIDPTARGGYLHELQAYLERHTTKTFESEHHLPDGRRVPVEVIVNHFDYNGKNLVVGYFRDISERKLEEQHRRDLQAKQQRIEIEQQYTEVFNSLIDDFYLLDITSDRRLRFADINRVAAQRFGLPAEQIVGRFLDTMIPADKVQSCHEQKLKCVMTRRPYHYEEHIVINGVAIVFDTTIVPIINDKGEVYRIAGLSRDITDRKRQEEEKLLREQEFRALVEHSRDVVIRYDTKGRRTYVNSAFLKASRVASIDEVLNKTPLEWSIIKHNNVNLYNKIQEVVKTRQSNELDLIWSDEGIEYCYECHLIPEFNPHDQVASVLCIGRDYSRRWHAELALQKREEEFRTLVENSPDIICRHELDGRRIYINPKAIKMSGDLAKVIMNSSPLEYPGGEEGQIYQSKIQEVINSGTNVEFELNWNSCKGSCCSLINLVPERSNDGRIISVLAIGRDITLLKRFRQDLEESRTQLRELVAHRERTREAERKHIAREVHDELGQQLTALNMEIQSMRVRYDKCSPPLQTQLNRIHAQLHHTISYARNLVSRLRPSALDMGFIAALEWLVDDFRQRNPKCECRLTLNCADVCLSEDAATAVFRIVQESLTNIIKHAHATQVHILLHELGTHLLLGIRDNGRGFDTKRQGKESFGLVGIKERAIMLGGELTLFSAPGKGTYIELHMPISAHNMPVIAQG